MDTVTRAGQRRLTRIESGNLGDHDSVGHGVFELRIHIGPGYRVYFGREGRRVVVLIAGGDKATQKADIAKAHRYWRDYVHDHIV